MNNNTERANRRRTRCTRASALRASRAYSASVNYLVLATTRRYRVQKPIPLQHGLWAKSRPTLERTFFTFKRVRASRDAAAGRTPGSNPKIPFRVAGMFKIDVEWGTHGGQGRRIDGLEISDEGTRIFRISATGGRVGRYVQRCAFSRCCGSGPCESVDGWGEVAQNDVGLTRTRDGLLGL